MSKFLILILYSLIVVSCQEDSILLLNTPFPKPLGEFHVGTDTVLFTRQPMQQFDTTLMENRHLSIQIWYPIQNEDYSSYAPYILDSKLVIAFKRDQYLNLEDATLNKWDTIKIYASLDSESPIPFNKYPLIVFSHGFGMSKTNYTNLSIELASHGYIVVTIDHPGSGLSIMPDGSIQGITTNPNGPDGKVIEYCDDISFTITEILKIDKFKNSINEKAIGVIGHSLGGAAALNIGEYDNRIKAAVNLDGYLFGNAMNIGIKIPFLSILQRPRFEEGSIPDSLRNQRLNEWTGIVNKSHVQSTVVNVKGLMHFDFSDLPYIIPDSVRVRNGGTLSAEKGHKIMSELIVEFYDLNLKDRGNIQLKEVVDKYDEVSFELK